VLIVGNSNNGHENEGMFVVTDTGATITPFCVSEPVVAIWDEYADIFNQFWGIDKHKAMLIGFAGGDISEIEYQEYGDRVYTKSVITPIRNAFYSCADIDKRWERLKEGGRLKEPILDYGCGVGTLLRFLQWKGYEGVYGYELPGLQTRVMDAMSIPRWDRNTPYKFGTVICTNVLEHLADPWHTLNYLRCLSDNVIADCDENDQPDHIAPMSVRREINKSLKETGEQL